MILLWIPLITMSLFPLDFIYVILTHISLYFFNSLTAKREYKNKAAVLVVFSSAHFGFLYNLSCWTQTSSLSSFLPSENSLKALAWVFLSHTLLFSKYRLYLFHMPHVSKNVLAYFAQGSIRFQQNDHESFAGFIYYTFITLWTFTLKTVVICFESFWNFFMVSYELDDFKSMITSQVELHNTPLPVSKAVVCSPSSVGKGSPYFGAIILYTGCSDVGGAILITVVQRTVIHLKSFPGSLWWYVLFLFV